MKKLKKEADRLFSIYIREKGNKNGYQTCYTCERVEQWKNMDCGHAIAGRNNFVRYNKELAKPQCRICNRLDGGRYKIFEKKLDREHFEGWYNLQLMLSKCPVKLTKSDIKDIIKTL